MCKLILSFFAPSPVICSNIFNHHMRIAGNPGLRQGKPGSGYGIGYGVRFKTNSCQINVDYAINAFHQRTVYFGISNLVLWTLTWPNFAKICRLFFILYKSMMYNCIYTLILCKTLLLMWILRKFLERNVQEFG